MTLLTLRAYPPSQAVQSIGSSAEGEGRFPVTSILGT